MDFVRKIWSDEQRVNAAVILASTVTNIALVCLVVFLIIPSINKAADVARMAHDAAERDYELIQKNNELLIENGRLATERQEKLEKFLEKLKREEQ